jgi:hypothetical protein
MDRQLLGALLPVVLLQLAALLGRRMDHRSRRLAASHLALRRLSHCRALCFAVALLVWLARHRSVRELARRPRRWQARQARLEQQLWYCPELVVQLLLESQRLACRRTDCRSLALPRWEQMSPEPEQHRKDCRSALVWWPVELRAELQQARLALLPAYSRMDCRRPPAVLLPVAELSVWRVESPELQPAYCRMVNPLPVASYQVEQLAG